MNPWHAIPVLLFLAGVVLLARRLVVAWEWESRPRVWRAAWRSEDGPSQVEVARRIAEAQRLKC